MSKEHQAYDLTANIQKVLAVMHTGGDGTEETNINVDEEERETIHVYPVAGGGILLTRTPIAEDDDLDTTPLATQPAPQPITSALLGVLLLGMLVPLLCIGVQLYFIVNPYTVTVTLLARSQQLSLQGSLQLGRLLNPITASQSATVPTTGRGHQDARAATGALTFYNGSNVAQTVNAGTILTGQDGIRVVTDQTVTVPAANLPQIGEATVSAHAESQGSRGNIQTLDITIALSTDLTVKNLTSFTGGQDSRDFSIVAKTDITSVAEILKTTVTQASSQALQGQLKTNEGLVTPSCMTNTTADHQTGEEATAVKVTVSETCSGLAVNQGSLETKVIQLLSTQAAKMLGSGYSVLGSPAISVTGAARQNTKVFLTFTAQSTWIYALTSHEQQYIKTIIAGKSKQDALQLLLSLPAIERVSLQPSGFGDDSRIPKQPEYIHFMVIFSVS